MKKSIKFFSFTLVLMMCCIFGGSLHVKAGNYENVMTPQLAVIKSLVGNVRKSQISKEKMLLISKLISAKEKTAAVELCDQYLKELGFSENEIQTFSNETKIAMFSEGEIETVSSYLSITEKGIIATIPQSTVDAVNPELLFPILEGGSEGDYNNAAWSANNGIIKVTIMCTYQRSQSEKGWYSFYSIYTWIVYQKHLDNMFDIDMYDASGIDWSTNSTDYSSTLRYDLGANANTITQTTSGRTLSTSEVSYAWTIPSNENISNISCNITGRGRVRQPNNKLLFRLQSSYNFTLVHWVAVTDPPYNDGNGLWVQDPKRYYTFCDTRYYPD